MKNDLSYIFEAYIEYNFSEFEEYLSSNYYDYLVGLILDLGENGIYNKDINKKYIQPLKTLYMEDEFFISNKTFDENIYISLNNILQTVVNNDYTGSSNISSRAHKGMNLIFINYFAIMDALFETYKDLSALDIYNRLNKSFIWNRSFNRDEYYMYNTIFYLVYLRDRYPDDRQVIMFNLITFEKFTKDYQTFMNNLSKILQLDFYNFDKKGDVSYEA